MINRMQRLSAASLGVAAAAMLMIAPVGGAMVDRLWLALVPATVLVFLLVGAIHSTWDGRDGWLGTLGAVAVRLGGVALLATAMAGFVVIAVRGVEPTWLSGAALVSAVVFVIGEVMFGVAAGWRRTAPRAWAILFAIAIPLGVAIDVLPQMLMPIPVFFTGAGVYVGLGLFALAVARLGWAARRRNGTNKNNHERVIGAADASAVRLGR